MKNVQKCFKTVFLSVSVIKMKKDGRGDMADCDDRNVFFNFLFNLQIEPFVVEELCNCRPFRWVYL